ncbi:MAG: methyl-accepting chemotaxis protein [Porticoccaceae bacterium]
MNQNAENARQANQLALETQTQANQGSEIVTRTVTAMEEINTSSRQIADIIGIIDDIAFQTNLLALNAAVEAARAGEQGRGFAVVASEVRNLSGKSAAASKDIKALIRDSVNKVEEGSKLVSDSGQALQGIVASVAKVGEMITEIAAASQEQSIGINQVSMAVTQMNEMTQQNAAIVEEASAGSQMMEEQSRTLMDLVEFFTIEGSTVSDATQNFSQREPRAVKVTKDADRIADDNEKSEPSQTEPGETDKPDDKAQWNEF